MEVLGAVSAGTVCAPPEVPAGTSRAFPAILPSSIARQAIESHD